jgi:hypothetical protein
MRQMNTDLHDALQVAQMGAGEHMLPRRPGARKRCYGDLMGDLQLYGMTNLALGEYRTFKQRSLNLLSISTAKELGIEMPPELVAGAYAVIE